MFIVYILCRWTLDKSLIGTNPGVGIRPRNSGRWAVDILLALRPLSAHTRNPDQNGCRRRKLCSVRNSNLITTKVLQIFCRNLNVNASIFSAIAVNASIASIRRAILVGFCVIWRGYPALQFCWKLLQLSFFTFFSKQYLKLKTFY